MTDLASLVLAIDSSQVPKGTAALDGLTAAGARAQAATIGLATGTKSAAVAATQMAAEAQGVARAATVAGGGLHGMGAAANNARIVGLELTHVTRAMTEQIAMGVSPVRALTMELGRLSTAAQYAGGVRGLAVAIGGFLLPLAAPLAAFGAAAGIAFGAFKQFQAHVKDSGELTRFRDNLGLTHKEMLQLSDGVEKAGGNIKKLADVALTTGDVMHGVWKTISDDAGKSVGGRAWEGIRSAAASAFAGIIDAWAATSAGITAGIYGTYNAVKMIWGNFPAAFGDLFVQGVNLAIVALNGLVRHGTDLLNGFIHGVNNIPGVKIGDVSAPQIGLLANPNAGAASKPIGNIGAGYSKAYAEARKADQGFWDQVKRNAIQSAKDRMKAEADALKADRTPKKPKKANDHGLAEALAELDAQIKGQLALAQAYSVSDAAVMRAEALQRAEQEAIRHKGETGIFYEKELAKAVATRAAEGSKVAADLRFETTVRRQANDAVAAGLSTQAQANQQLELANKLRPLQAAYANAEGEAKERLAIAIRDVTKALAENNAEMARAQALGTIAANDNDIARLRLEASLIGASNRERAVALAQLEAEQRLKELPGLNLADAQKLRQSYADKANAAVLTPFQQWAASIPQTAAAINDALQTIEFRGFDGLASAITDVVTGTKSLGQAFKDIARSIIADIIQMTVRMLIFRAISSIFGGAIGGSVGKITASIPGKASGGPVSSGQTYLVGENGPELFRPSSSGSIVPNNRLAANNNQGGPIEIKIGFGDAPGFAPYVQEVSAAHARQAVSVSVNHTNQSIRTLARPKLMGR